MSSAYNAVMQKYGSDIRVRVSAPQRTALERLADINGATLSGFCRAVLAREIERSTQAPAEPDGETK